MPTTQAAHDVDVSNDTPLHANKGDQVRFHNNGKTTVFIVQYENSMFPFQSAPPITVQWENQASIALKPDLASGTYHYSCVTAGVAHAAAVNPIRTNPKTVIIS